MTTNKIRRKSTDDKSMTNKNTPQRNSHSVYTLDEIRKKLLSFDESEENFEFYNKHYAEEDFLSDSESDLKLEC